VSNRTGRAEGLVLVRVSRVAYGLGEAEFSERDWLGSILARHDDGSVTVAASSEEELRVPPGQLRTLQECDPLNAAAATAVGADYVVRVRENTDDIGYSPVQRVFGEERVVGFRFQGFFSDGDKDVMAAALRHWPFCDAEPLVPPGSSFGLRVRERLAELGFAVERGLAEFSQGFPAATFAFIDADCFIDPDCYSAANNCFVCTCVYTGFVVRAGEVLSQVESAEPAMQSLERLLLPLHIRPQAAFARVYR
jgi:hypothetical protein